MKPAGVVMQPGTSVPGPLDKLQKTPQTAEAARLICRSIRDAEASLRERYSVLQYQDTLGLALWAGSLLCMALLATAYWRQWLSIPVVIVAMALSLSILHEMEHDIIHNLYFRKAPIVQDFMFLTIWLAKLHGNPWFRRELHLKHHLVSGQKDDAEERLIGLGLPFGFKRMAVTVHPVGSVLVTRETAKDATWLDVGRLNRVNAPVVGLFVIITKLFLWYSVIGYFTAWNLPSWFLPARFWPFIRDATILICAPNILRQSCLVLMSNCSHYYGDIPEKDVSFQNQILDSWLVLPFQLFCFNFGSTHIVHHYVPGQPFYIRHFVAQMVKDRMVSLGVRRNDLGIVWRANYYTMPNSENEQSTGRIMGVLWFVLFATVGFACIVVFDFAVSINSGKTVFYAVRKLLRGKSASTKRQQEKVDVASIDTANANASSSDVDQSGLRRRVTGPAAVGTGTAVVAGGLDVAQLQREIDEEDVVRLAKPSSSVSGAVLSVPSVTMSSAVAF